MPVDIGDAQAVEITHDINNLLTAILGHAQVALGDGELSDVHPVGPARDRPGRPPGGTPDPPARCAAPAVAPTGRSWTCARVVGAMGRMLWPLIGEDVELRTESGSRPIRVEADPVDLEGIVLNLAINARDAMPTGGVLTLGTAVVSGAGGRRAASVGRATPASGWTRPRRRGRSSRTSRRRAPAGAAASGWPRSRPRPKRNGWTLLVDTAPGEGSRFTVDDPAGGRRAASG